MFGVHTVMLQQLQKLILVQVQLGGVCHNLLLALAAFVVGSLDGLLGEGVEMGAQGVVVQRTVSGLTGRHIIEA